MDIKNLNEWTSAWNNNMPVSSNNTSNDLASDLNFQANKFAEVEAVAWAAQLTRFKNALAIAIAKATFSSNPQDTAKWLAVKENILTKVSYKNIDWKVYVVFPASVLPKPLSMTNATVEELQQKLGSEVVRWKNHWKWNDFINSEALKLQFWETDYFDYSVIDSAIDEKISALVPQSYAVLIMFAGWDNEWDNANWNTWEIIAELLDLQFTWTNTINTSNNPLANAAPDKNLTSTLWAGENPNDQEVSLEKEAMKFAMALVVSRKRNADKSIDNNKVKVYYAPSLATNIWRSIRLYA